MPTTEITRDDLTADAGRTHAENLFRTDAVVLTADVARGLAESAPVTRDFWTAYADRLDELTGPSRHDADLEVCYARGLAAMAIVQRMWDTYSRDPRPTIRRRDVLVDVQSALAAFGDAS